MSAIVIFQEGWRLCGLCSSLVFNPKNSNLNGCCAIAESHLTAGSRHYQVPFQTRATKGQTGWRWCWKCEALFFNGHKSKGVCPMDKGWHDGSESGKYELLHSGQTPQPLYDWRWCAKCEQVFVPEFGRNACPKGELHDAWGTYVAPVDSGYYYIEESFSSKSPEYAEKDPNSIPKVPEWI